MELHVMKKLKTTWAWAATGALFVAMGCETPESNLMIDGPEASSMNKWMVESYLRRQEENALTRQHTIYPYHFIEGSAQFNDLGHRDIAVLAGHIKKYPGMMINVRHRGQTGQLMEARVDAIKAAMTEAGLTVDLVSDGTPGGEGMASQYVLSVWSEEDPVWQTFNK